MSVPLYRSQYLKCPINNKVNSRVLPGPGPGRLLDAVFSCSALFMVSGELALAGTVDTPTQHLASPCWLSVFILQPLGSHTL